MRAAVAKIDITPAASVWMDGMPREHRSEGVHDPVFARALVLANDEDLSRACVCVSADVCSISQDDATIVKNAVNQKKGIPQGNIIIAATHSHSGPATVGYFNPVETEYVAWFCDKLVELICGAADRIKPVIVGCDSGMEDTISHYRRLLADDGHVVMNWEPFPPERIVKVLGQVDPELGVLKIADAESPDDIVCILFNFACHPNVLSGDSYVISAEFPGFAVNLLEEELGCTAMFVNAAEGTMDIDGLKDRDWGGVVRIGTALANAVSKTAAAIQCNEARLNVLSVKYTIPKRNITAEELNWAENILKETGGSIQCMADGVGDDFKAKLYKDIHDNKPAQVDIEQICFVIAQSAFISFPGEAFTEVGMRIKQQSPFEHTYFIGLANGTVGYIPTKEAISQGGYAVDTRSLSDLAEDIIIEESLALLNQAYELRN